VFFPGIAAGTLQTVNPSGSSDLENINDALQEANQAGGGAVYLNSGTYDITGPIEICSNTALSGDPNAVLTVSCPNGRWFSNSVGVINAADNLQNVEISGFSINGDCEGLPFDYSHTASDTAHDCESLIHLSGDSNNFMNSVSIHDMKLYDSFSDGITIRFCNNANCYDNEISNAEHEGIFYICCVDSTIHDNKVAGITSDCLRLDNSQRCLVENNTLFSYNGSHAVTYSGGENGLQVGNAGSSKGYDASNKPISTENIEVTGNIFADNGLKAILLDSVALAASSNVFIHDNSFLDKQQLETSGISVDIGNNMPTQGMSDKVFGSIFDILSMNITGTQNANPEDANKQNIINIHENAVKTVKENGIFHSYTLLLTGVVGIFVFATYRIFQGMII
jgi:hypothetical protein